MRSILFSLTLVFFTGCLTEATTANQIANQAADQADDPADEIAAVGDAAPDDESPVDRDQKLDAIDDSAAVTGNQVRPRTQPDTLDEPDCRYTGKPLDPRCKHPH